MFVKLLTLLFYNVFISFSVLVCSKSLTVNAVLRVEFSKGDPVIMIERTELRSSASALEPKRPRPTIRPH
jgi:hypothetical protein